MDKSFRENFFNWVYFEFIVCIISFLAISYIGRDCFYYLIGSYDYSVPFWEGYVYLYFSSLSVLLIRTFLLWKVNNSLKLTNEEDENSTP